MTFSSKLVYWLPTLTWLIIIFLFSAHPAVKASGIDWQDFFIKKTAHFAEYAILTFLICYSLINTTSLTPARIIRVAVFCACIYAVSDELHQSFVPGREPHFRDIIIDAVGSFSSGIFLRRFGLSRVVA